MGGGGGAVRRDVPEHPNAERADQTHPDKGVEKLDKRPVTGLLVNHVIEDAFGPQPRVHRAEMGLQDALHPPDLLQVNRV